MKLGKSSSGVLFLHDVEEGTTRDLFGFNRIKKKNKREVLRRGPT